MESAELGVLMLATKHLYQVPYSVWRVSCKDLTSEVTLKTGSYALTVLKMAFELIVGHTVSAYTSYRLQEIVVLKRLSQNTALVNFLALRLSV